MRAALAIYAALILSFLGGAQVGVRGGAATSERAVVVSLAMLPTLVGFALCCWSPASVAGSTASRAWELPWR